VIDRVFLAGNRHQLMRGGFREPGRARPLESMEAADIETNRGNLHPDGFPHVIRLLWHPDAGSGRCPPHHFQANRRLYRCRSFLKIIFSRDKSLVHTDHLILYFHSRTIRRAFHLDIPPLQ
jgi:hypothetical protein